MNGKIEISLELAREWFFSNDKFKQSLALRAFGINELKINTSDVLDRLSPEQFDNITRRLEAIKDYLIYATFVNGNWEKRIGNAGFFIQRDSIEAKTGITKGTYYQIACHNVVCQNIVYFKEKKFAEEAFKLFIGRLDLIL